MPTITTKTKIRWDFRLGPLLLLGAVTVLTVAPLLKVPLLG